MAAQPTDAQCAAFRRDGAVPLRGLLTDWVEPLRVGVDRSIAEPSADVRIYDDAEGRRRRAFSSRWIGDDATYAVRPGVTSPPFREVTLAHGAPMDAPEFPLVHPARG